MWGKVLASISPLTYFVDLVRFSIRQDYYYPVGIDLCVLFIFALFFYMLAIVFHNREMPRRI